MFTDGDTSAAGSAPQGAREGSAQRGSTGVEMQEVTKHNAAAQRYGTDAGAEADSPGDVVVDAHDGHSSGGFRAKLHYIFVEKEPLLCHITKWVFVALLALFLAAVVFGIFYSGLRTSSGTTNTTDDTSACDTPFGTILGSHNGVMGFSNCNSYYVSRTMYSLPLPVRAANGTLLTQEVFVGMRWQCVEYARRYWMLAGHPEPAFFGDVDGAADIWGLTEVTVVSDMRTTRPLHAFPNGASILAGGAMPQTGDILIYPRQLGDEFPAGHVAVVVKVELVAGEGKVYVAEQNWDSHAWVAPFYNHSRTIPLSYNSKTFAYTISDPYGSIDGWMRYS